MPKRLSVNELEAIKKHRYIIKQLAFLTLTKLRKVLENAPNELFRVIRLILAANSVKIPPNFDIKAFARAKVSSFRKLLVAAVRYNESLSLGPG